MSENKIPIQILDCTPAMADGIRPRERRKKESAVDWYLETPAAAKIRELVSDADPVETELKPPAYLGLPDSAVFRLTGTDYLVSVNSDGTRAAVVDMLAEFGNLWERENKRGRPRVETDDPKHLAQRRWREKKARGEI